MDYAANYKLVERIEDAAEALTIRHEGNVVGYAGEGILLVYAARRIRQLQRWRLTWFLLGALFGVIALGSGLLTAMHYAEAQRAVVMKNIMHELRGKLPPLQELLPPAPRSKIWNPMPARERDA